MSDDLTQMYGDYLDIDNDAADQAERLRKADMADAARVEIPGAPTPEQRTEKMAATLQGTAPQEDPAVADPLGEQSMLGESDESFGAWFEDTVRNLPKNFTGATVRALDNMTKTVLGPELYAAGVEFERAVTPELHEAYNAFTAELTPESATDETVQEIAQFMIPFTAWSKVLGVAASGTPTAMHVTRAIAAEGLTMGSAMDPHMERLSDMAQSLGIEHEIVGYFAGDGGSEAENRMKNVIDGVVGSAAIGGALFAAVQSARGLWRGGQKTLQMIEETNRITGTTPLERVMQPPSMQQRQAGRLGVAPKKATDEDVTRMIESAEPEIRSPLSVPFERSKEQLRKQLNRKPDVGMPKNRTREFKKDGQVVIIGAPTADQWLRRVESVLTPDEVEGASRWYELAAQPFVEQFGEEEGPKMMAAWLLSNKNVDPAGAMLNALRVREQLASGAIVEKRGGLADPQLRQFFAGEQITQGLGRKLHDFVDSAMGKTERTWMGNAPEGGLPAVVDIHSGRDMGLVDEPYVNWIREKFGDKVANSVELDMKGGAPGEPQYEAAASRLRALTDELNTRGFLGGELTPAQVQAIGWVTMQRQLGRQSFDALGSLMRNRRQISFELDFGTGAPLATEIPELATLPFDQKAAVTRQVLDSVTNIAGDITQPTHAVRFYGPGGWKDFPPAPSGQAQLTSSPETAEDFAAVVGYLAQQDEVLVSRPKGGGNKLAIDITAPSGLENDADIMAYWDALRESSPEFAKTGFHPMRSADGAGIRTILQGNLKGKTVEERAAEANTRWEALAEAVQRAADDLGLEATADAVTIEAKGLRNNWETNPDGKGYLERLSARYGPEIQRELRDRAEEIKAEIKEAVIAQIEGEQR